MTPHHKPVALSLAHAENAETVLNCTELPVRNHIHVYISITGGAHPLGVGDLVTTMYRHDTSGSHAHDATPAHKDKLKFYPYNIALCQTHQILL